jgi:hypothetical protein
MEYFTRTIYSNYLQTCLLLKRQFNILAHSTLNEKFGIQADTGVSADQIPSLGYYAIGNGGHTYSIGADNIPLPEALQHVGTDAALFNHLPFVLREINNDLTPGERAKYGLRRTEIHDGLHYYAYYLKRLDLSDTLVAVEYITNSPGGPVVSTFVPSSANLNPVPVRLSPTDVNIVSGDLTSVSAKLTIPLEKADIDELLAVARIIYKNEAFAIISEVCLCSGIDKVVQSASGGNSTINFNEVIAVQALAFINTFFALKFNNAKTEIALDVGATEPLFAIV